MYLFVSSIFNILYFFSLILVSTSEFTQDLLLNFSSQRDNVSVGAFLLITLTSLS